eukprot:Skav211541  [mRNA]  locus=scaffold352:496539:497909:- [translate_table: standard]
MLADMEVELEEERLLRGYLEKELEDMKAKKVEWRRLVRGSLMRLSDLEEQLRWSEAATEDVLQEVEDLKIELDEERGLRGCLENELAQKDGGLKTLCDCGKDNTRRRSLDGNSVDSHESTWVPDKEDLLELTLPGTSGTKRLAAKPEVFHMADSEDEADNSVGDRSAFGKDEAACEPLLTSDCKAEREVISEVDIFTTLLELCKQDLEHTLPGTLTSGTKSPTVGEKLVWHRVSDVSTRLPDVEDDLEEQDASDASDASSPGEGFDPNSLQMDFLSEEVPEEMMEMPQIEHQDQVVHRTGEQDGFLPQELWSILLEFLPVAEVVNKETRTVSRFFSNSKIWLAHLLKLMDFRALPQCADGITHPAYEWARRYITRERNASEGLQGYRCFLNGIAMWHASSPEMVQPFLATAVQYAASRNPVVANIGRIMWRQWGDRSEPCNLQGRFDLHKRPGSHR